MARLANNNNGSDLNANLIPLRNRRNEEVNDFPPTRGHIGRLRCEFSLVTDRHVY